MDKAIFQLPYRLEQLGNNNLETAKEKLIISLNTLGAFVDIMAVFDAENLGFELFNRSDQG